MWWNVWHVLYFQMYKWGKLSACWHWDCVKQHLLQTEQYQDTNNSFMSCSRVNEHSKLAAHWLSITVLFSWWRTFSLCLLDEGISGTISFFRSSSTVDLHMAWGECRSLREGLDWEDPVSVPSPCGLLGGRGRTQYSELNIKSLTLSILRQSFPHLQDQYAVLLLLLLLSRRWQ